MILTPNAPLEGKGYRTTIVLPNRDNVRRSIPFSNDLLNNCSDWGISHTASFLVELLTVSNIYIGFCQVFAPAATR